MAQEANFTYMENFSGSSLQMCRLCMSEDVLRNVFHEEGLHQCIMNFLSIEISPADGMSQAICARCHSQLSEFHQFRLRCLQVQDMLKFRPQNGGGTEYDNHNCQQFKCQECGTVFQDDQQLYQHMRNHGQPAMGDKDLKRMHGPKRYDCERCERSFARREHLQSHLMRFHQVRIDNGEMRDLEDRDEPTKKTRRSRRRRRGSNIKPNEPVEILSTYLSHYFVHDQRAGNHSEYNDGNSEPLRRTRRRRMRVRRNKTHNEDHRQLEQSQMMPSTEVTESTLAKCKIEPNDIQQYRSPDCSSTKNHVEPKQEEDTKFNVKLPRLNGGQEMDRAGTNDNVVLMFEVENIKVEPE